MSNGLEGKRVLITGGASGIGAEISRLFAKEGAIIGIHYSQNKEAAEELRDELSKFTKVNIYQEDFSKPELNLIKSFMEDFGGIDILINNAGVLANKSFLDIDAEEYDTIFNINTRGSFLVSRDAFRAMKDQNYGRIVNIGSISVKFGMGRYGSIHYAASKAALETLTTGLSRMGAKHNITANTIRPTIVNTRMQKGRVDLQDRIDLIPMGRMAEPKEIADMALFLCSKKGDFITGQTISISGGE